MEKSSIHEVFGSFKNEYRDHWSCFMHCRLSRFKLLVPGTRYIVATLVSRLTLSYSRYFIAHGCEFSVGAACCIKNRRTHRLSTSKTTLPVGIYVVAHHDETEQMHRSSFPLYVFSIAVIASDSGFSTSFSICKNAAIQVQNLTYYCDSPYTFYYGNGAHRKSDTCDYGDKVTVSMKFYVAQAVESTTYMELAAYDNADEQLYLAGSMDLCNDFVGKSCNEVGYYSFSYENSVCLHRWRGNAIRSELGGIVLRMLPLVDSI